MSYQSRIFFHVFSQHAPGWSSRIVILIQSEGLLKTAPPPTKNKKQKKLGEGVHAYNPSIGLVETREDQGFEAILTACEFWEACFFTNIQHVYVYNFVSMQWQFNSWFDLILFDRVLRAQNFVCILTIKHGGCFCFLFVSLKIVLASKETS